MTRGADRYEILEIVGTGGQGEVARAHDRLHDRVVALKIRTVSDDREREEVLREAKNLRAARPHPALTLVREDFLDEGRYTMVMDWIEGRTLAQVLHEEGPLSPERVVEILTPVAGALDHLHAHVPPIAHGDVKPANILLTPDGAVVLVDLGTSVRGPSPATTGTSGYVAPETARGEPLTPAADVYALAATAHAALTGRTFRHGVAPEWRGLAAADATRIERALSAALHPDPGRRTSSAGTVIAQIAAPVRPQHNLPAASSSFVGRASEVRAARTALRRARLVTLVGPGGVGKTRLACAVGEASLRDVEDGVWLVTLATLDDPALLAAAVARVLGVPVTPGGDAASEIAASVAGRRLLMILDNAEHLLDAVADLTQQLLAAAPGLRILVTSREPLRIAAESLERVAPLAVAEADGDAGAIRSAPATRLFVDRARAVDRRFRLTPQTAPAVAEICRRLDGLPLALEIAAARIDERTPEEVAALLDAELLDLPLRAALPHHRMLRALVAWSDDLLPDGERALLRRLGAFAGSFDVADAAAVTGGADVASSLYRLSERSLLQPAGPGRYTMLETIRGYAREQLDASGESDETRRRHLEHVGAVAGVDPGHDRTGWLQQMERVHDELRAALRWSVTEAGDPIAGLGLAVRVSPYWLTRGHYQEGGAWLEHALEGAPDAPERLRATALNSAGHFAREVGRYDDARSRYEASLRIWRHVDDPVAISICLNSLGNLEIGLGNLEAARALHEESLAIKRAQGDEPGAAIALTNLGLVMQYLGDLAAAQASQEEALAIKRAIGDRQGEAASLDCLAVIHRERGEHGRARELAFEAASVARAIGDRLQLARVLETVGYIDAASGDAAGAVRSFGCAAALREDLHSPVAPAERGHLESELARAREALGPEGFALALEQGRAADPDELLRA